MDRNSNPRKFNPMRKIRRGAKYADRDLSEAANPCPVSTELFTDVDRALAARSCGSFKKKKGKCGKSAYSPKNGSINSVQRLFLKT